MARKKKSIEVSMNKKQIKMMLEMAKERRNFKEIARLQKILAFQNPRFKYPPKRPRKLFTSYPQRF